MKSRKRIIYTLKYVSLPLFIIALWEFAAIQEWIAPYALPAPSRIFGTFMAGVLDLSILWHIWASVLRVLGGFALAAAAGLATGILTAQSRSFKIVTQFVLQVLKPIPPIAWIPIAILWLGIGEPSKLFIIFIGAFFPIYINVVSGIKQIDRRYVEVSQIFEVNRSKFIRNVVIPGAMPSIISGMRIGLSNAWICVVAAEMIAAPSGIGYLLMDGRQLSQPDIVILAMLLVGIIGKLMDDALGKIEKKLYYW